MPYIHIVTSRRLDAAQTDALRRCALDAAALMGKPRERVMVRIESGASLTLGETAEDCAFCDVRVLGAVTAEACNRFAARLSGDVAHFAHTRAGGVYLSLTRMTLCYTDGALPPGMRPEP